MVFVVGLVWLCLQLLKKRIVEVFFALKNISIMEEGYEF